MKSQAHRWYSAFRNVGVWALCVVVGWFAIVQRFIGDPRWYDVAFGFVGLGLLTLPIAFLAGLVFPFRSEGETSCRQTAFAWVAGALLGVCTFFGLGAGFNYLITCPLIEDERLFEVARESLDRVADTAALETEIDVALTDKSGDWIDVWGNDTESRRRYPALTAFLLHLHRRRIDVTYWRCDEPVLGPMLVVRIGNHSNYVWIGLHRRWNPSKELPPGAKAMTPYAVFSPTILP